VQGELFALKKGRKDMTMKKTAAILLVLIAIAGIQMMHAAAPEQSSAPPSTPRVPSFTGLQSALGLTDSQVSQLQSLVQSQAAGLQTLLTNLRTAQQALQTALKGTDTAAIGTANLAVQSAQTALANAQKSNLQALMVVLTPSQQQVINDYLLIASNGGPGPFGLGGPGMRGPGGPGDFRGPRP
jgi:Spy/CpxP family protein refolding chaperone